MIGKQVLCILVLCVADGLSSRILGFFPTPSKSHLIIHMAVVRPLLERDHDVTVITNLPLNYEHPKLRYIQLVDDEMDKMSSIFIQKMLDKPKSVLDGLSHVRDAVDNLYSFTNWSLNIPTMKAFMEDSSNEFDLLILGYFFNEFHLGLASHFKCPSILIWMNQPLYSVSSIVGNPLELSYVPALFAAETQPMGFWGRVKNFIIGNTEAFVNIFIRNQFKKLYDSNFPLEKYRSFEESLKNVSLVFVAHHFTEGRIRPNVPAMIEIGGIQMKSTPNELPEKLKSFLDNSSEPGAIFVSFRSNVDISGFSAEILDVIFKVLSNVKENVIMNWEKDVIPIKATNIYYDKWLPQDDILAHPNLKLFITHGGHGSVVEAKHRGIPMLGTPVFADQHTNIQGACSKGTALQLDLENFTEHAFRDAIHELITNATYRNRAQHNSQLYKDRIASPQEVVVFWTEYVLRNRGAPHLQSPAIHMSTFTYHSLDVIGLFLVLFYIIWKATIFAGRLLCRLVFKKKSPFKLKTN